MYSLRDCSPLMESMVKQACVPIKMPFHLWCAQAYARRVSRGYRPPLSSKLPEEVSHEHIAATEKHVYMDQPSQLDAHGTRLRRQHWHPM